MNARYSSGALQEIAEATQWYLSRAGGDPQLADRFVDALARAEQLALERPLAWPELEPGIRRVVMIQFPFSLIYELEGNELRVLAVAHQSRQSGYWRERG